MTVQELIAKLQAFPPDARVLVNGYEGGLSDPRDPHLEEVVLNYRGDSYFGPHEKYSYVAYGDVDDTTPYVMAVLVER